jgi:glutamyl-tRNA synthetase
VVRTRIAPTPSGFLHAGNALNFLIIERVADVCGAEIALRIDDVDTARIRDEYIEDVFEVLTWLNIDWTHGPRAASDMVEWSQRRRLDGYAALRDALLDSGFAYACSCSRADWDGYTGIDCPGSCGLRNYAFQPGITSVRVHVEDLEDPVVWRRDDVPAYHLTSVADDHEWNIDLVVRGDDLRESTDLQERISTLLPQNSFARCQVLHHPLITHKGLKLSKSAGSGAAPMVRTAELRDELRSQAASYVESLPPALLRSRGS